MTVKDTSTIGKAAQTMTKRHQEAEELIYNPHSGTLQVVKMGKSSTKGGKP